MVRAHVLHYYYYFGERQGFPSPTRRISLDDEFNVGYLVSESYENHKKPNQKKKIHANNDPQLCRYNLYGDNFSSNVASCVNIHYPRKYDISYSLQILNSKKGINEQRNYTL